MLSIWYRQLFRVQYTDKLNIIYILFIYQTIRQPPFFTYQFLTTLLRKQDPH